MKKLIISILLGFFAAVSLTINVNRTQDTLSNGIIRLHIRANSNSHDDQELKLKVRDRILSEVFPHAEAGTDIDTVRLLTSRNLRHIEDIAEDEIRKNGYSYDVKASFGKSDFPVKAYGNLTFPAGTYEALTVNIGSSSGENWWCVMFPPLCFADEAFAGVSPASEEILIQNLGDDTYSMINNDKIQIKFKIYELIKELL